MCFYYTFEELNHEQGGATKFFFDEATIPSSKNLMLHNKSEHIKILELVTDEEVEVWFFKSQDQMTHLFTKPLKMDFIKTKSLNGVTEV